MTIRIKKYITVVSFLARAKKITSNFSRTSHSVHQKSELSWKNSVKIRGYFSFLCLILEARYIA